MNFWSFLDAHPLFSFAALFFILIATESVMTRWADAFAKKWGDR